MNGRPSPQPPAWLPRGCGQALLVHRQIAVPRHRQRTGRLRLRRTTTPVAEVIRVDGLRWAIEETSRCSPRTSVWACAEEATKGTLNIIRQTDAFTTNEIRRPLAAAARAPRTVSPASASGHNVDDVNTKLVRTTTAAAAMARRSARRGAR